MKPMVWPWRLRAFPDLLYPVHDNLIPCSHDTRKSKWSKAPHLGHFAGVGFPDFRVNRV